MPTMPSPGDASPNHPWGTNHLDGRTSSFRDDVDLNLVKALAARHNDNKFCRISSNKQLGRTFVCVFVTFPDDGKEWVVRIPVPTTENREWDIVRSEVATIRHIQYHTKIPVPTVHAYGTNERLVRDFETTQSYVIMDRMPGKPLELPDLVIMTKEKRLRLFSQLGDVMAQLQGLRYIKTGSLYPDGSTSTGAKIGPSLCQWDHHLADRDSVPRSRPAFKKTWDCIQHHLSVLSGGPDMCMLYADQNDPKEDIPHQMVAMDFVARHVNDENHAFWRKNDGFALSKGSFNSNKIFVDDQGNITGVINWAWCEILPRQLCLPMNWVLDVQSTARQRSEDSVWQELLGVITPDHAYYDHLQYYLENEKHLGFASILRYPKTLTQVYFWDKVYDAQHPQQSVSQLLDDYFSVESHRKELERRLEERKRYMGDSIVRLANVLELEFPKWREWHLYVNDLVILASKLGYYTRDDMPSNTPMVPIAPTAPNPLVVPVLSSNSSMAPIAPMAPISPMVPNSPMVPSSPMVSNSPTVPISRRSSSSSLSSLASNFSGMTDDAFMRDIELE